MLKKHNNEMDFRIKQLFEKKSVSEIDFILNCVGLIIHHTDNEDLTDLYKVLKIEDFVKLITLFDGRTITLPKKHTLKEIIILALCYYYKEIKGMSWDKIKKEFPFDISSIKYGLRIKSLNNFIINKLKLYCEQYEEEKDK